jgi:predicted phosphodiesterase
MDLVFSDLHIGLPTSAWPELLDTLQQLFEQQTIDSIIFAGDTVDLTRGDPQRIAQDFDTFCTRLDQMHLLSRVVFLHGNHDPTLERLPTHQPLTVRPAVLLRHPDTSLLILHGDGVGLETAMHHHPTTPAAFTAIKDTLASCPPLWLPQISTTDWLIAGHYTAPHLNPTTRTAGLSPWTHPLTDHWHGHYLAIQHHATLPPVTIHKYRRQGLPQPNSP